MDSLNKRIEKEITFNSGVTFATYTITNRHNDVDNIVYAGRVYKGNNPTAKIYLNDILENDLYDGELNNENSGITLLKTNVVGSYRINLSGATTTNPNINLWDYYPPMNRETPNINVGMVQSISNLALYNADYVSYYNSNQIEYSDKSNCCFIPIYSPNYYIQCNFNYIMRVGNSLYLKINYTDGTFDKIELEDIELSNQGGIIHNYSISMPTSYLFEISNQNKVISYVELSVKDDTDTIVYNTFFVGSTDYFKFPTCKIKYMVKWIGRNGGCFSYPLIGKDEVNESFSRKEIVNLYNEKSSYVNGYTTTFELNSGFVDDDFQRMIFEDLSVANNIVLYSVDEDREYKVINRTNNFTYKTFKNEKKPFNYSFTFELNKEYNIKSK